MTDDAGTPLDERLLEATVGALEIYGIHLGRTLGLYTVIAGAGSVTESELARAAGISERYAREWLEQQAVSGYVTVTDDAPDAKDRRYGLNEEQRAVLVDAEDPAHVSPLATLAAGIGGILDPEYSSLGGGSLPSDPQQGTMARTGRCRFGTLACAL
jgi:winged helix-turn-helix protein